MKYLFCYTYKHPQNGLCFGDSVATISGPLTESELNNARAAIAKTLGVVIFNHVAFTSVHPLAS